MEYIHGSALIVLALIVVIWSEPLLRRFYGPRLELWSRKRQILYMARQAASKARQEAWDASYRCYDLCEPPAYIRKAEGYRWLGRVEG